MRVGERKRRLDQKQKAGGRVVGSTFSSIPRIQRITAHDYVQKIDNHYFPVRQSGLFQLMCIPYIVVHYHAMPAVIAWPIERTHQQPLRCDAGGLESSSACIPLFRLPNVSRLLPDPAEA